MWLATHVYYTFPAVSLLPLFACRTQWRDLSVATTHVHWVIPSGDCLLIITYYIVYNLPLTCCTDDRHDDVASPELSRE